MNHTCHAVNCNTPVDPQYLMCGRHWRMVPKLVQDLVWHHYRPGQEIDKAPTVDYIATAYVAISCVAMQEGQRLPTFGKATVEAGV